MYSAIKEAQGRFPGRRHVLEFGVLKGQMINYQASQFRNLAFVGFDSFEGLREGWPGVVPRGTFDLEGRLPKVRSNVSLIKGWFSDTWPAWRAGNADLPPPLLLHIDCDTYEATVEVLEQCGDYVRQGVMLHFDDYFGFPNWKNCGHKALHEVAARQNWKLTYLCYGTKEVGVLAEADA